MRDPSIPSDSRSITIIRSLALAVKQKLRGWLLPQTRDNVPPLRITGKLDLGTKRSLLLIAWREQRFLVAQNAESITAMLEISCARSGGRATRPLASRPAGAKRAPAAKDSAPSARQQQRPLTPPFEEARLEILECLGDGALGRRKK